MKRLLWDDYAGTASRPTCAARAFAAWILAAILAWAPLAAASATLPPAEDLSRDASQMRDAGQPMVVLFSQRSCGWCDRARVQLAPMAREVARQGGVVFRQIDIDRDAPLVDFSGQGTSHRRFSRDEGVRFTPTVIVFGPDGRQLAEPILGMRLPDFYAHYVGQAIDQARNAMMTNIEDAGK